MGGGVAIGVGGALLGLVIVAAMFAGASLLLFLVLLLLKPTRSEIRQLNPDEIAARASYRSSALVWSIALGIGLLPALYIVNAPYIQKELTRLNDFPHSDRIVWIRFCVAAGELLIGVFVWRVALAVTLFIRRRRVQQLR
jgi:DNA polymerase III psi subunit